MNDGFQYMVSRVVTQQTSALSPCSPCLEDRTRVQAIPVDTRATFLELALDSEPSVSSP